jgi:hypothetical protein
MGFGSATLIYSITKLGFAWFPEAEKISNKNWKELIFNKKRKPHGWSCGVFIESEH